MKVGLVVHKDLPRTARIPPNEKCPKLYEPHKTKPNNDSLSGLQIIYELVKIVVSLSNCIYTMFSSYSPQRPAK
jgi:hypothetical protein